jgi:hypothetical protein
MNKLPQTETLLDAVGRALANTRAELRRELYEETSSIRAKLNMPIVTVKGMAKPRVRVPHRFGIRL